MILNLKRLTSVCALAMLAACNSADHISISGSTTVLPAVSKTADSYSMDTGKAVVVNAGGSGSGFNQLAEGQTDIGMMSRDITADEKARR